MIRDQVKDILHLPPSTPNGLLYCGKKDGGLGTALKHGIQAQRTDDQALRAVLQATNFDVRLERMAKSIRLPWPCLNLRQINAYKKRKKAEELQLWKQIPSKGKGVESFVDDKYGNCWLYDPTLLKPSRFLTALRMRSSTTSDRVSLHKAIPQATITCRKCKEKNETLAHILGQCLHTKKRRIQRHNDIRDFVSQKVATNQQYQVIEEASVDTPLGKLKPDLVMIHQERVLVVDVTVRHQDKGYLEEGFNSKVQKYQPLLPLLSQQLQREPGKVVPIVIGTRGALPKATILSLEELGIKDRKSLITLTLLALRSSIEIYHAFIDYDAPGIIPRQPVDET
jgi:hypothetical protein